MSAGATPVQCPEVREQVTDRQHRRPREPHVLEDHVGVVLATAREIRDQLVVGEGVGVDRLQLAMGLDRGRLERLVPLAQLLAPDLALPHLFGAGEALRDLVVGCRPHRVVREAVDVLRLQRLERSPVERHELMRAPAERLGVHLRPVPRHRSREMHRVQVPRPGTGRLEVKRRRTVSGHAWPSRVVCRPAGAAPRQSILTGRVSSGQTHAEEPVR